VYRLYECFVQPLTLNNLQARDAHTHTHTHTHGGWLQDIAATFFKVSGRAGAGLGASVPTAPQSLSRGSRSLRKTGASV
jgi:hypothetical protein